MKELRFLLIVCFTCISNALLAQEVYVDINHPGEEQTGSFSAPFKSVQQGVNSANEGDVIYIKGGVYREQVEIAVDSITIQNYPGEKVVVSGAEPVVEWEDAGNEVYRAIVPWDVSESDQANQVFVDGKMIHLARWPKETSAHWVTKPTMAKADNTEDAGSKSIFITDNEYNEPKERWTNSLIWINLANGHDGNGWSGRATYINSSTKKIKVEPLSTYSSGVHAADGYSPWGVRRGSKYYLFNPSPSGVYATGGPQALLTRGEWWKNGDTLFVRLPDGNAPADESGKKNLVEVKKRIWAFRPAVSDEMHHVTIKGLHLFAASITTDKDFTRGNLAANSYNNVIDSIQGKYIMHFIDQGGHYGLQWKGKCGIILSGINHTVKKSKIHYSAGSAVSAFGNGHKILNNAFYDVNYQVTEAGALNSGGATDLYDPEIAFNLFYNNPHMAIAVNKMYSTDPEQFGLIRIHHNVIQNFMLRSSDGGAINCSAGRNWDNVRIDHNIIANSNEFLTIGIYTDYGGEALFDHNVIYNVDRPMQINRYSEDHPAPVGSEEGGPMGEIRVFNNTIIADNWTKPGVQNNHVNPSGEGMFYKNNIISNRIKATLELAVVDSNLLISEGDVSSLFVDYENHDFRLSPGASEAIDMGTDVSPFNDTIINGIPDIGAYEYGAEPWRAGPENVTTNVKILGELPKTIYQGDTLYFSATAFTSGFFEMDPQPQKAWFSDGSGRINQTGMYVADSVDNNANVYVMVDSILVESKSFRIKERLTSIDSYKDISGVGNGKIDFTVFPNPATSDINIEINGAISSQDPLQVSILDLQGRTLIDKNMNKGYMDVISLGTDGLTAGLYYIRIVSGTKTGYRQLVIHKQ